MLIFAVRTWCEMCILCSCVNCPLSTELLETDCLKINATDGNFVCEFANLSRFVRLILHSHRHWWAVASMQNVAGWCNNSDYWPQREIDSLQSNAIAEYAESYFPIKQSPWDSHITKEPTIDHHRFDAQTILCAEILVSKGQSRDFIQRFVSLNNNNNNKLPDVDTEIQFSLFAHIMWIADLSRIIQSVATNCLIVMDDKVYTR